MIMQFIANGLINGALLSLAAIGFALIYNTTKIFHIAYAGLYVFSAYVFWQMSVAFDLPQWTGLMAAMLFTGILSILIEKLVYRPMGDSKATHNSIMVASIGVFTILINFIALIWGNETKVFSSAINPVYQLHGILITQAQLIQLVIASLSIPAFFIILNFSGYGLRIKALRDDPQLLRLNGFNPNQLRLAIFFMSGMFAALSAGLASRDIGMDPYVGMPVLLNAVVAIIIGGAGRFEAAVFGGLTIGILQALVVWQWSAQWQEAITFVLLLFFLIIRPHGIIGEKQRNA